MGSISGWMSSPSASVYAAAKAATVRFVESVNIELEAYGSANRILDVSPASFRGSRFYGGKNDLTETESLARDIVRHLLPVMFDLFRIMRKHSRAFLNGIIMIRMNTGYTVISIRRSPEGSITQKGENWVPFWDI